ncbi:universal stress protein [Flavitalea flava]
MKTIVVPVNFSVCSNNAARYAADMAQSIQADLHLIHVVEMPVTPAEIPMSDAIFEEMLKNGAEGLQEIWEELLKRTKGKQNIFISLETGSLEYRLEQFCARKNPFAVIMGNSVPSFETLLAGRKTQVAIHNLHYPLIIVPAKSSFQPIKKIVLACDPKDLTAGMQVAFLNELREIFSASLEVIHISTGEKDRQLEGQTVFAYNSRKDNFRDIFPDVHFIHAEKVEEGLNEYVEKNQIDLLLVFPKKHSLLEFHRSHAKKIAAHCSVPVMSIHE